MRGSNMVLYRQATWVLTSSNITLSNIRYLCNLHIVVCERTYMPRGVRFNFSGKGCKNFRKKVQFSEINVTFFGYANTFLSIFEESRSFFINFYQILSENTRKKVPFNLENCHFFRKF